MYLKFHFRKALLGLFIVFLMLLMLNVYFIPSEFAAVDARVYNLPKDYATEGSYAIDTVGCQIPEIDPFDASIKNFTDDVVQPFHCPCDEGFGLTYMENSVLKVNRDILFRFPGNREDLGKTFNCCMWDLYRHEMEENDNILRFPAECTHFQESIPIQGEYLKVECYLNSKRIHETFYVNMIRKRQVEERCEKAAKKSREAQVHFNVIILFLDSVSRVNFRRNFPETRKVLVEELKAIELNGYNRVADNTFPNLLPILAGMSEAQIRETCWKHETDYFDDCKFIWKDFANLGFRTAYVEDFPDIAAFNFEKSGFKKQPTDYYGHNFLSEAYKLMFFQRDCLNGIPETEMVFKWCYDFMKLFQNDKHFGIFATSRFTHTNNMNRANLADSILKRYLRMMKYDGLMKNTFLFIMSDHGVRYGDFRETVIGCREVNLPAFYIVPPDSFEHQFPQSFQILGENAHRLTTPYDFHETLQDIVNCNFDPSLPKSDTIYPDKVPKQRQAISLFRKIPVTRTCLEVGIPRGYCGCYISDINLKHDLDIVEQSVLFLIDKLNNITDPYRNLCAIFVPDYVLRAREIHFLNQNNEIETFYEITFGIEPGAGLFQGIITRGSDMNSLVAEPDISRLDMYGSTSACVSHNSMLRKYCHCI